METTQCFLIRTLYTTLKFASKDLQPYQGQKVLIDESILTNKHQSEVTKADKPLRLKIEARNPVTGQVLAACNKAECVKQRSKRFETGKKGVEKLAKPNQILYAGREAEADDIIVDKDNSITLKVRPDCCSGPEHIDLPYFLFFVEILDSNNLVVFRTVFYSMVKANQRSAAPTRFCEIPLKTIAQ